MVFSSAVFVFGFMPLLLFLYFLAEPKYRNYILLIFSLIFYGWGGVNYLLLMLAVVMSDYVFAIAIAQIKTQKIRKLFVVLSVVVNLGVLGYYKYPNFFMRTSIISSKMILKLRRSYCRSVYRSLRFRR